MNSNILVYPNITYQRNLEKDSWTLVMKNIIPMLPDTFQWTILTPKFIQSLKFPNTRQIPLPLPSYPNAMRLHFDVPHILDVIDWKKRDYDVVYTHLPEHTLQLKNLFWNLTNLQPIFTGCSHWFEVPENTNYKENVFPIALHGILEMQECGVNSTWVKDLALKHAAKHVSSPVLAKLRGIIQHHYLGMNRSTIVRRKREKNLIVFNHRDNAYTGFKQFIRDMDTLWERRQDFKVLFTLVKVDKPYAISKDITSRDEYLEVLSGCYVGVGRFQGYSAWSLSSTDGLSVGVPYLLPNDFCYPEMVGEDYPLLYDDFLPMLERTLDDAEFYAAAVDHEIGDHLYWDAHADEYLDVFRRAFAAYDIANETESYKKILAFIREHGQVTKADILRYMNWGVRIPWTPYRNRLRLDGINMEDGYSAS